MRIHTIAAVVGVMAGGIALGVGVFYPSSIFPGSFGTAPYLGLLVSGLGLVLVVASFAGFFGPRAAFYVEAGASAMIVLVVLQGTYGLGYVYPLAVAAPSMASTVLGLIAGRARGSMSEQGNPMNLPVFG